MGGGIGATYLAMNNFHLLAISAMVFLLASIVELIYGHVLFGAGCVAIGFALAVAAYGARPKHSG